MTYTRTRIQFFGCKAPPYPGASAAGCEPTSSEAISWMVVVGGTSSHITSTEDFAQHFKDFLLQAYHAGRSDMKTEIAEKLFG